MVDEAASQAHGKAPHLERWNAAGATPDWRMIRPVNLIGPIQEALRDGRDRSYRLLPGERLACRGAWHIGCHA